MPPPPPPLFPEGTVIHGPQVIQTITTQENRQIILLGENHRLQGACPESVASTHVVDHLFEYAKAHPDVRMELIYESSVMEVGIAERAHRNPIYYVNAAVRESRLPANIRTEFANVRREFPLDLFECLYDVDTFALFRYMFYVQKCRRDLRACQDYPTFLKETKVLVKRFEKEALTHLNTRKRTRHFLEALIWPEYPLPKWYMKFYNEDDTARSWIKHCLEQLDAKDRATIRAYVKEKLEHFLESNTAYSAVMQQVLLRRKTASPNMEFMKNNTLQHFFMILYSLLQDIYVFTHAMMSAKKHTWDIYVVLVGAAHAMNMSRIFTTFATDHRVYVSHQGCIRVEEEHAKRGPIAEPLFAMPSMEEHFMHLLE